MQRYKQKKARKNIRNKWVKHGRRQSHMEVNSMRMLSNLQKSSKKIWKNTTMNKNKEDKKDKKRLKLKKALLFKIKTLTLNHY